MPQFSAFTPFGMLEMSSKPSHAENIYQALLASQGGNFAATGQEDASTYARAMALARCRYTLEHAGYQIDPLKVTEMVGLREGEYAIVPAQTDTLPIRRATLAAAKLLPLGGTRTNIENALRALLGTSDFLAYVPTTTGAMVNWPTTLGAQPMNLQLPTVPRKLVTITQPITGAGAQTVTFTAFTVPTVPGAAPTALLVGDVLVVDTANDARSERVTVTAATAATFTATFTSAHDVNVVGTTAPWPMWRSTKRYSLIVLSATAAADPEKRRKVNELMGKMTRATSTWAIASGSGGATRPWTVGVSKLGISTIGAVTYP